MANKAIAHLDRVRVVGFDNLTVDLANEHGATILIRGLRAVSDFEYELQLGYLNNSLDDSIETRNLILNSMGKTNELSFLICWFELLLKSLHGESNGIERIPYLMRNPCGEITESGKPLLALY